MNFYIENVIKRYSTCLGYLANAAKGENYTT